MKVEDVLSLIRAGYTRDDILAMEAGENIGKETGDTAPAPEKPADPLPEIPADPAPEPAAPEKDNTAELIAALTKQVASLTQQITRSNLLNAQQPPAPDEESAEKILASIINPSYRKGK